MGTGTLVRKKGKKSKESGVLHKEGRLHSTAGWLDIIKKLGLPSKATVEPAVDGLYQYNIPSTQVQYI